MSKYAIFLNIFLFKISIQVIFSDFIYEFLYNFFNNEILRLFFQILILIYYLKYAIYWLLNKKNIF
jgi:hypothetical protein